MNSDDKFEILNEIDSWEKEIKRLQNSDEHAEMWIKQGESKWST